MPSVPPWDLGGANPAVVWRQAAPSPGADGETEDQDTRPPAAAEGRGGEPAALWGHVQAQPEALPGEPWGWHPSSAGGQRWWVSRGSGVTLVHRAVWVTGGPDAHSQGRPQAVPPPLLPCHGSWWVGTAPAVALRSKKTQAQKDN